MTPTEMIAEVEKEIEEERADLIHLSSQTALNLSNHRFAELKAKLSGLMLAWKNEIEFLNLGKTKIEGKTEDMEFLIRQRLNQLKQAVGEK